jgi:16S rRNA (adenine1518-N6/adenine1519-N6)-dimethyltransferase
MDAAHRTGKPSRRRLRRLGQHFLTAPGALARVLDCIAAREGQRFLEIGPGRGALTRPLAATGAWVLALEMDPLLVDRLRRQSADAPRLTVLEGDILKADLPELLGRHLPAGPGVRAVGNLPYSIASPTILKLLGCAERFADLTLMVQREVADRILSPPGRRAYGVLTLLCACRADGVRLLDLGPAAFSPRPQVDSTLLRLVPRSSPPVPPAAFAAFDRVVKAAFAARRKTIRNSLAASTARDPGEAEAWLRAAGIDPSQRPEEIPLEAYVALARTGPPAGPVPPPAQRRSG